MRGRGGPTVRILLCHNPVTSPFFRTGRRRTSPNLSFSAILVSLSADTERREKGGCAKRIKKVYPLNKFFKLGWVLRIAKADVNTEFVKKSVSCKLRELAFAARGGITQPRTNFFWPTLYFFHKGCTVHFVSSFSNQKFAFSDLGGDSLSLSLEGKIGTVRASASADHRLDICLTLWIRWMLHWKWNNGQNWPHRPVRPIWPIFPFPVQHPPYPPCTPKSWNEWRWFWSYQFLSQSCQIMFYQIRLYVLPSSFACCTEGRKVSRRVINIQKVKPERLGQ